MLEAPKGEGDLSVITPETLVDVYLGHVSFGHCTSSLSGIDLVIRFQCTKAHLGKRNTEPTQGMDS